MAGKESKRGKLRNSIGHFIVILIVLAVIAAVYCMRTTDRYLSIPSKTDMTGNEYIGSWIETGMRTGDYAYLITKDEAESILSGGEEFYPDGESGYQARELALASNGRAMEKTKGRADFWGTWSSDEKGVKYVPLLEGKSVSRKNYERLDLVNGMTPADMGYEGDCFLECEYLIYGLRSKTAIQDRSASDDLSEDKDNIMSEDSWDPEGGSNYLKQQWNEFWKGLRELIGKDDKN